MGKRQFQVTTDRSGKSRTVRFVVYDDLKDMRKAASAWTWRTRQERDDFSGALGAAHRFERVTVEEERSHPLCGVIRLHRDHLTMGIITHEVCHLALWIYELDSDGATLTTGDIENEERFCHIVGDISSKLVRRVRKLGYYD